IIQNNIAGLSLANNSTADQALIQHNVFRNNNNPGPFSSGTAIYTDQINAGGNVSDVLIDGNNFFNNQNVGVFMDSTSAAQTVTNLTISNNEFDQNGNA